MKRVTIILMQLFFVLWVSAQNHTKMFPVRNNAQTPKLGIVGGAQLSNFHNAEVGDPNIQGGFHFGLTYELPLSQRVSLEPQLIYSKKGGEIDYAHAAYFYYYSGSLRYRLHYLEMPLQFNIHSNRNIDFILGRYTAYLADATFNVSTSAGYGYGELNYADFKKFDFGLSGGIAFRFPVSKMTLKYSHGFNEVASDNSAYLFLEGAQNSVFSISFTRYFR